MKYRDLMASKGTPIPVGIQNNSPGSIGFPGNPNRVGGEFLALFNSLGAESVAVCGFPITGEIQEGGGTVQAPSKTSR